VPGTTANRGGSAHGAVVLSSELAAACAGFAGRKDQGGEGNRSRPTGLAMGKPILHVRDILR
jgi:hypothetical protein